MHALAEALAISKGPRLMEIKDNVNMAAYMLTKEELKALFVRNGYNVKGMAWLRYISGWREYWGDKAPTDSILMQPDRDWCVAFMHPCPTDYIGLQMFAENNNVHVLAVEE